MRKIFEQTLIPPTQLAKRRLATDSYGRAAVLAHSVADDLIERLDLIKIEPQRILEFGSRDGYLTAKLKAKYPNAEIVQWDLQPHTFLSSSDTVITRSEHAIALPDRSVDFIISNCWLHWENDLQAILQEFYRILQPNGLLMFSLLGPDTLKELRQSFATVSQQPHIHRFVDMHDLGDELMALQFENPVMDMHQLTFQYPNLQLLFQDIKHTGSQNALLDRSRGLMGKQAWQAMLNHYETLRNDREYPVTFEIVHGHAWKSATPKQTQSESGEFYIPVDILKS